MSTVTVPPADAEFRFSDRSAYSGWLLKAFPEPTQLRIFSRAVIGTAAILGVEYVLEIVLLDLEYWENQGSYFASPDILLSALGLVFSLVLLGQWGARYVELWETVRPAFAVPDERYDATVRRNLGALYDRDHIPFLLFVCLQLGVYGVFGSELPAGYLHVGFLHFFAVTALYGFYRHTVTIGRVTDLELVDLAEARPTLSQVADFSVVVCLNWFAALAALVVYIGFFMGVERYVGLFYATAVLFFVGVGLLVFVIPVVLLHEALAAAKRERLNAIYEEYEALFEAWRRNDLEEDPSVALDILEQRRRNAEERSTWPYRLVSVGKLALGSIVPTVISVLQAVGAA